MKNRNSNSKMRKNNNRKLFSNNKLLNNKLLNNKITLFIVTALALFSLYIHITKSNFSAVLLFFLTAALVYTFTKNMILVLGASFIVTTIASMSKNLFGLKCMLFQVGSPVLEICTNGVEDVSIGFNRNTTNTKIR